MKESMMLIKANCSEDGAVLAVSHHDVGVAGILDPCGQGLALVQGAGGKTVCKNNEGISKNLSASAWPAATVARVRAPPAGLLQTLSAIKGPLEASWMHAGYDLGLNGGDGDATVQAPPLSFSDLANNSVHSFELGEPKLEDVPGSDSQEKSLLLSLLGDEPPSK